MSKVLVVAIWLSVLGRTEIAGELITILVTVTTTTCGIPVDISKKLWEKLVGGNFSDFPDSDNVVCNVSLFGVEIKSSIEQRTCNCNLNKIARQTAVDHNYLRE